MPTLRWLDTRCLLQIQTWPVRDCLYRDVLRYPVGNEAMKALLPIVSYVAFIGLLAAVVVGGAINAKYGGLEG